PCQGQAEKPTDLQTVAKKTSLFLPQPAGVLRVVLRWSHLKGKRDACHADQAGSPQMWGGGLYGSAFLSLRGGGFVTERKGDEFTHPRLAAIRQPDDAILDSCQIAQPQPL